VSAQNSLTVDTTRRTRANNCLLNVIYVKTEQFTLCVKDNDTTKTANIKIAVLQSWHIFIRTRTIAMIYLKCKIVRTCDFFQYLTIINLETFQRIFVIKVTRTDNLVRVRWAVETPGGVNIIRVLWLFVFFRFFNKATAHTREPIAQKTQSGVRKTLLGMRNVQFWNLRVFYTKTPLKLVGIGNCQPQIKCRITPKR